jgi:excinuclease UvrABC helicase subunit UvrB
MVAMDEAELAGFNVMLRELTDGAKSQFDGDLKAHIRYQNDDFYLFTGKMSKNEAIEVLSHEVIHMLQYRSGNLSYTNGKVTWMGEVLDLNSKEYEQRPWEVEAFQKQSQLMGMVKESLWGDN